MVATHASPDSYVDSRRRFWTCHLTAMVLAPTVYVLVEMLLLGGMEPEPLGIGGTAGLLELAATFFALSPVLGGLSLASAAAGTACATSIGRSAAAAASGRVLAVVWAAVMSVVVFFFPITVLHRLFGVTSPLEPAAILVGALPYLLFMIVFTGTAAVTDLSQARLHARTTSTDDNPGTVHHDRPRPSDIALALATAVTACAFALLVAGLTTMTYLVPVATFAAVSGLWLLATPGTRTVHHTLGWGAAVLGTTALLLSLAGGGG
ncbi:hypothetical protein [Nocardioides alkalitolerans]|uniref:hypothetical protein n=1 Tax=Nocardioides alkalitolerans TaxID=281714 RepID=UPI000408DA34|nr:hypothetical protein [Nocardioides alkalitolerans]